MRYVQSCDAPTRGACSIVDGPTTEGQNRLSNATEDHVQSRRGRKRVTHDSRVREQSLSRAVIGSGVVLGGVVASVGNSSPTGIGVVDVVLTGIFVGAVGLAASRARRRALLFLTAVPAALATTPWAWPALVALVLVVAMYVFDRRHRAAGATVGVAAAISLLGLPTGWTIGVPSLVSVVAVGPTLISGYLRATSRERRVLMRTLAVVALLAVLALTIAGFTAWSAKGQMEDGLDLAQDGLSAIRSGEQTDGIGLLSDASDSFGAAESRLTSPLLTPARALPIVAQHIDATEAVARSGANLTRIAAKAASEADYTKISMEDGVVDLELVTSMQEPVERSVAALLTAQEQVEDVDTQWLIPPVADPLERFAQELSATAVEATTAQKAVTAAPWLLGEDDTRRYAVLLGQPAESRFGGGFVGTWAEVEASNGRVEMVDSGNIDRLIRADGADTRKIELSFQYMDRYARYFPERNLQNLMVSPDLPTVRNVAVELWPQIRDKTIDGVIYLDPEGLAALLALTGPVEVEGLDEPLTTDTAADLLTIGIYEQFPAASDRDPILEATVEAVFDALTTGSLASPNHLGDVMGPAARAGHLKMSVVDETAESFLAAVNANGALPDVPDGEDFVALKTANAAPNKLDPYLERSFTYDVNVDPLSGLVDATATVELVNNTPSGGLPAVVQGNRALNDGIESAPTAGTALLYLSLYSVLDLAGATIDGQPLGIETQQELQRWAYSTSVVIPPGGSTTLEFDLTGFVDPLEPYRATVGHQPLTHDDRIVVRVGSGREGWRPVAVPPFSAGDDRALLEADLTENLRLEVPFEQDPQP